MSSDVFRTISTDKKQENILNINNNSEMIRNTDLKQPRKDNYKYIYYYNKPGFISSNVFDKCEYKCKMTSKSNNEYAKSDAVIFFGPKLGGKINPPKKRNDHIWVLHVKESPANYFGALPKWKNLFNWTMTFRRDSDILAINGIFSKRTHISKNLHKTVFTSKSKSIAWFVSNCRTPSRREALAKSLSKLKLKVDVFGGCGTFRCPRGKENVCMDMIRNKYKFYLSFENSLCHDYITEKTFKIFENLVDAIPIVRGIGDQYHIYLPPNSFISTGDFTTVKELTAYIKKVESNGTLFESFFKWKPHFESYWPFPVEFCELCRKVHNADRYKKIYSDVGKWETLKDYKEVCRKPIDVK